MLWELQRLFEYMQNLQAPKSLGLVGKPKPRRAGERGRGRKEAKVAGESISKGGVFYTVAGGSLGLIVKIVKQRELPPPDTVSTTFMSHHISNFGFRISNRTSRTIRWGSPVYPQGLGKTTKNDKISQAVKLAVFSPRSSSSLRTSKFNAMSRTSKNKM